MRTSLKQQLVQIDRLLVRCYGEPRAWRCDPLDSLIATILSQNTNDTNSGRAYDALRAAFPTWEGVLHAPPRAIERAIAPGGLARTKSRRIHAILRSLSDRGEIALGYLRRLSTERAEEELVSFKGVGFKTARCVLLFALGRDVFPIDTHIERVLKRLSVLPAEMSPDDAHAFLPAFIPKGRCLALHLNLIAHGRNVCHARDPQCPRCALRGRCAYYKENPSTAC